MEKAVLHTCHFLSFLHSHAHVHSESCMLFFLEKVFFKNKMHIFIYLSVWQTEHQAGRCTILCAMNNTMKNRIQ
uniref:Uncharacterized protein n=1 Tax=Rhipicephalus pulchellus TaxID=72859 RepID=L7LW73_RHIPC